MKRVVILIFAIVMNALLIFSLTSCGDDPCQHRDADDNSLCDKCGESYTDGKDVDDSTPCSHRDANDNSLCDNCGESYTDGKDVEGSTPCSHRDADDNSLCDICGESYTDEKDLPDEHTHSYTVKSTDSKYLDKAADCENAATYFYSCSCGKKGTTTFTSGSANGHSYNEQNTDSEYLATTADCENAATYFYSCSCGAKGTATFTSGSANGHSYTVKSTDSKYLDKAADCENAATYFYSCSCGEKGTTTFTSGSANGHSYTVKSTDSKYLDKAADCENAATYFYSCSCGEKGTTTFTHGNANGHNYVIQNVDPKYEKTPANEYTPAVYWKSCACGKASTTETFTHGDMLPGYLTYQLSNDSSFYIVTGFVGAEENITIPHIYDSLPVFGVMTNAFKNNTTLKSISMPNSIQEIGSYAFAGCTSLESVSIPTSVKNVSPYTFSGCTSLKTITLHSGIEELGAFAFENCTALKSITLNEGLKTISNNAFDNCSSLEGITIPDSVTTLGNMAFRKATSLKYVNFSKALESIGNSTFQFCASLESVELHENITSLGNSTFSDCRGLKTLRILGNLESIGFSTFYDCHSLTSIYFASKTPGDCGNTNYIFYNAGNEGDGITLTIAKDAVVPDGFFTPYVEDNIPKITSIIFEEGTTKVEYFKNAGTLPYLKNVTIPIGVTNISAKAFFGCADLSVNMVKDDRHYFGAWYDNASFSGNAVALNAYAGESEYLYAEWLSYSISIDKSIDVAGTISGVGSYTENEKVTVTAQTNDGYTFLGWYENGTCVSTSATYSFNVNKATSLTAMWEANTYTIIFDADGGTTPEMLTVTYNENYTLPETAKTGYTFIGWFDGEIKYENSTWYGLSDITLTAKWSANKYNVILDDDIYIKDKITVTFDLNYSGSSKTYVTLTKNGEILDYPTMPTRDGYVFVGWYTSSDCTIEYDFNNLLTDDCTLYAGWVEMSRGNAAYERQIIPSNRTQDFSTGDTSSSSKMHLYLVAQESGTHTIYFSNDYYGEINYVSIYNLTNKKNIGDLTVSVCENYSEYINKTFTCSKGDVIVISVWKTSFSSSPILIKFSGFNSPTSTATARLEATPTHYYDTTSTYNTSVVFGNEFILPTLTKPYYNFLGWYNGETKVESGEWNIAEDVTLVPKFEPISELKDFTFTYSDSGVQITGVVDKTKTSYVIPDCVTSIASGAFRGCSSVENMTLPFVGGSKSTTSASSSTLFGYIFGTSSYTGGVATEQYYISSSSSCKIYYIPSSLKCVTVTGGNILRGAFYNCSDLTSVTIGDSVTSIGDKAFYKCTRLTSVTIPDSVETLGEYAFANCSKLSELTLGNSIKLIGNCAFYDCTSLIAITVDADNQYYKDIDGNLYSKDGKTLIWYAIGKTSTSFTVPNGVTTIGSSAFESCTRLTSVTIPDSVTSIGNSAFSGCASLTRIEIPDSVTSIGSSAFRDCTSLTSVTIPDSVTSIRNSAFSGCSSLTSIEIPDSVTSIGSEAFYYCTSLTSVTIPDSVTSIGSYAFRFCTSLMCVTIPDSVTSIGSYAFEDCDSLTSVTIPDSVTSIGEFAFSACNSLTSVVIGNSVTSIDIYAFSGCFRLVEVVNNSSLNITAESSGYGYVAYYAKDVHKGEIKGVVNVDGYLFYTYNGVHYLVGYIGADTELTLPDSYNGENYAIKNYAFSGCTRLTSVTISNSVTSIGGSAFRGCSSLQSITLPFVGGSRKTASDTYQYPFGYIFGTSSYTGGVATKQYYYGSSTSSTTYDTYYIPSSLKSVTITGGNILYGAFYNCTSLTSVTIPDSVETLGEYAFAYCSKLSELTLGNSIKLIGNCAFRGCTGLTSVTIPDSVTSIGDGAFYNCTSLTNINYPGTEAEWNAISKGSDWDRFAGNYAITYNYEDK